MLCAERMRCADLSVSFLDDGSESVAGDHHYHGSLSSCPQWGWEKTLMTLGVHGVMQNCKFLLLKLR